jgi:hypothetical protein
MLTEYTEETSKQRRKRIKMRIERNKTSTETEKLKRKGRKKILSNAQRSLCATTIVELLLLPVPAADSVLSGGGKVAHWTLRDVISSHHCLLFRRLGSKSLVIRALKKNL